MSHASAEHNGIGLPPVPRVNGLARLPAEMRRQVGDWRRSRRREHNLKLVRLALASSPEYERFREIAFTFAVTALAAKLAQAGDFEGDPIIARFQECFPWLTEDEDGIGMLFDGAERDTADVVVYARQVASLYPAALHRQRLEDTFARLVRIASPTHAVSDSQRRMLQRIGEAFGLKGRSLTQLLRGQRNAAHTNPYTVLQVKRGWSDRQIRQAYLRLVRDCHPDSVQARGGSASALQAASDQLSLLNAAYTLICRERGLKG